MQMNLDWRPLSAVSYVVMAYAYTRKFDDEAAIPLLQKALEIDPENGAAKGYLYQLQQFQRRRD
jgi:Tfp pilus assembly protein PilF